MKKNPEALLNAEASGFFYLNIIKVYLKSRSGWVCLAG